MPGRPHFVPLLSRTARAVRAPSWLWSISVVLSIPSLYLTVGCTEPVGRSTEFSFLLTPIRCFGWPDAKDAEVGPNGDGVLGRVRSIRTFENSVYVLDGSFKKIVAFDSLGRFSATVAAGFGEGPGEFMSPTSMDLDPFTGSIAVFDRHLARVTRFSLDGEVLSTATVPIQGKDVLLSQDEILLSHLTAEKHLVTRHDARGNQQEGLVAVTRRDRAFFPFGAVSSLGRSLDGKALVTPERPGIWYRQEDGWEFSVHGQELLPNEVYRVYDGAPLSPGQNLGITGMGNGQVAVMYRLFDLSTDSIAIKGVFLDFYDQQSASYLGTAEVPHRFVVGPASGFLPNTLLVGLDDPYPLVVEVRVDPRPLGAAQEELSCPIPDSLRVAMALHWTQGKLPTIFLLDTSGKILQAGAGSSATLSLRSWLDP